MNSYVRNMKKRKNKEIIKQGKGAYENRFFFLSIDEIRSKTRKFTFWTRSKTKTPNYRLKEITSFLFVVYLLNNNRWKIKH